MTDASTAPRADLLDAATLMSLRTQSDAPRILDVRTPEEYASGHIPGSVSVPLSTLTEHRDGLLAHLGDDLVLVCQGGARAEQARKALADSPLQGVRVLQGGFGAWQQAGGDVVRGREVWAMERQVRMVEGSVVLTGVLASTVFPKAKWGAAFIGGGLTFSALSDTCGMAIALSKAPWNRIQGAEDPATVIANLSR